MTLLVSDVLPAANCDDAEATALSARCRLPRAGIQVADLPATSVVCELAYEGFGIVAPLAAPLGGWIAETDHLASQQFGRLLPDLERAAGQPDRVDHLSDETVALLRDRAIASWSALGRLSCSDIREWPHGDQVRVHELAVLAVRQATITALTLVPAPKANSPFELDADLRVISAWAGAELKLSNLGHALAALAAETDAPPEVVSAWRRLSNRSLDALAGEEASLYDIDAAMYRVLRCDARVREILEGRVFAHGKKRTLDDLGDALGITRERVRQIEKAAREEIDRRIADPANAVVARAAARLDRELGSCAAIEGLRAPIQAALLPDGASTDDTLPMRVLLQLAGPYEVLDRWVIRGPAERLVGATSTALEDAAQNRAIPYEDAQVILADAGIPEPEHEEWLTNACHFRILDGQVISWRGSMADKAERVLALQGEPMTIEEVVTALGPEINVRSLLGQIQGDPRFLRRGKKSYGLSSWGGEEYTKIEDEITQEIERQGGSATLDHLIDTLCAQFGVSESSVRAYAGGPLFMRLPDGSIGIAAGDHRRFELRAMAHTKACFKIQDQWALRIVVDPEVLRGSGRSIPIAVMQHLGVGPGETVMLHTRHGDIALRWGRQAHIGSLREAASALDCEAGDLLFVHFLPEVNADFAVARQEALSKADGLDRLVLEVGATLDTAADRLQVVGAALGFDAAERTPTNIRRRLRGRQENDLADLVPDVGPHDDHDDVLRQLIGLGE